AHWGSEHVKEMLNFLINRLSEMGEGGFKAQVWNQVTEGEGERTAEFKYSQLSNDFMIVQGLKNASGFHLSDKDGACIMMETESVWQTYTKNHEGSSRFHNKGFAFYNEMQQLVPQK
ncbi:hypothetical protein SCLCIDRAFT_70119, partial [Scleroderma citrinum Foug A]